MFHLFNLYGIPQDADSMRISNFSISWIHFFFHTLFLFVSNFLMLHLILIMELPFKKLSNLQAELTLNCGEDLLVGLWCRLTIHFVSMNHRDRDVLEIIVLISF